MIKEELITFDEDKINTLPAAIQALWHDYHGHWGRAHELVQDEDSEEASRVHAYLHRKEGDESNARYWYRNAGENFYKGSLEDEWEKILSDLT